MTTILLVDDDLDHLDVTTYGLRREGFSVAMAMDGAAALERVRADEPSLVVLDIRMPKISGFEVLRTIRLESRLPVIMLSAHGDDEDVVRGLRLGADDYVTKPFSPRQLAERIRAVLRRSRAQLPEPATEVAVAGLVLAFDSHELRQGELAVRMTPIQFRILRALLLNAGRVVPTLRLIEQVWGYEGGDASMLKTHVSQLRKKLGRRPGEPGYIKAIPGTGYILGA